MFWHDIKEIKEFLVSINDRLNHLQMDRESDLKEGLADIFCSDDESNSINRIHDKLNILTDDVYRKNQVILAQKTLDKFDEYMKNVDKLNIMINEFKGCVSMARAGVMSRSDSEFSKLLMKTMVDFHNDILFKLGFILKEIDKLKSKKKRESQKKKKDGMNASGIPEGIS